LQAQLELMDLALVEPVLNIFWDQRAIVAFDEEDKAVGVITWQHVPYMKQIDVALGYVPPQRRREHIYTHMWTALVEKAKELNVAVIASTTHMNNRAMRFTALKHQRREKGVVLRYYVKAP
jgi:predicted acetyltransferase